MANRFTEFTPQGYVSQYVPVPFEELSAVGAATQKRYDNALSKVEEASIPIVGGPATKDHAAFLWKRTQDQLKAAEAEAVKNNDYSKLGRDVTRIANSLKADPMYQGILQDRALEGDVNKKVLDPVLKSGYKIQNYYDPQTKQIKQLDVNTPFNASYYSEIAPKSVNEDFKSEFNQIKPIFETAFGKTYDQFSYDPNGNLVGTYTTTEGTKTEFIDKNRVKEILAPYILSNPNVYGSKESLLYNKAAHEQQNPGSIYDLNDSLEDVTNAFLGTYEKKEDIIKNTAVKAIPASKGTGSTGAGNGNTYDGDNVYKNIYKNLEKTTKKTDKTGNVIETKGETKITTGDAMALEGVNATVDKNGKFPLTLSDSDLIIDFNNTGDNKKAEKLNIYLKALDELQIIKEKYTGAEVIQGNLDAPSTGTYEQGVNPRKTRIKDVNEYKNSDEYKNLKVKYASLGMDIEDKQLAKEYSELDTEKLKNARLLTSIAGTYQVSPSQSGNNVFTDSQGIARTVYDIEFTEDQLEEIIPSNNITPGGGWKDLVNESGKTDNVITKTGRKDDNGDPIYTLKAAKQLSGDTNTATSMLQLGRYGNDAKTQAQIPAMQEENSKLSIKSRAESTINNLSKELSSGKITAEDLDKSIFVITNEITNEEAKTAINEQKTKLFEEYQAKKLTKKQYQDSLSDLYLMITDSDGWQIIHPDSETQKPVNQGKAQGNWTTTPANPLK